MEAAALAAAGARTGVVRVRVQRRKVRVARRPRDHRHERFGYGGKVLQRAGGGMWRDVEGCECGGSQPCCSSRRPPPSPGTPAQRQLAARAGTSSQRASCASWSRRKSTWKAVAKPHMMRSRKTRYLAGEWRGEERGEGGREGCWVRGAGSGSQLGRPKITHAWMHGCMKMQQRRS